MYTPVGDLPPVVHLTRDFAAEAGSTILHVQKTFRIIYGRFLCVNVFERGLERPEAEVYHYKRYDDKEHRHNDARANRAAVAENGSAYGERGGYARHYIRRYGHAVIDKVRRDSGGDKQRQPERPSPVADHALIVVVNVVVEYEEQRYAHVHEQDGRRSYYKPLGNSERQARSVRRNSSEYTGAVGNRKTDSHGCEHAYPKERHARQSFLIVYTN